MLTLVYRIGILLTLVAPSAPASAQTSDEAPFTISVDDESLEWTSCTELLEELEGCELAVIRGDLENGPAEVFVRLAPGAELPRIRHAAAERGLTLRGSMVRPGANGDDAPSSAARYWYLPPNTVHGGVRCHDEEECLVYESYDSAMEVIRVR